MVAASQRTEKVIWGHIDAQMALKIQKEYPEARRVASPKEIHKLYLMYFAGLLPFTKLGFQAIWLP